MPIRLTETLAEEYWSHNSSQEHAIKHMGDIDSINTIRVNNNANPFDKEEMFDWMLSAGLVTVRTQIGSGVGDAIGYIVSDRRGGIIDVKDLYVDGAHRGKGVAGFLLGKLITNVYHNMQGHVMIRDFGTELVADGQRYRLPGRQLTLFGQEERDKFVGAMPSSWTGLRSIWGEEERHELIEQGEVLAEIHKVGVDEFVIAEGTEAYQSEVFAAIAALNCK